MSKSHPQPSFLRRQGIFVTITNLLGQKTSPILEVTNQGYHLDTKILPKGVYYLQIRDSDGILIKTERIVIWR